MKKLTTFIATLTLTCILVGCGNTPSSEAVTTENVSEEAKGITQEQYNELHSLLEESIHSSSEVKNMVNELQSKLDKQNASNQAENTDNPISSEPVHRKVAKKVYAFYNEKLFPMNLKTEETKSACIETPDVLPYTGTGPKRDVYFIISGSPIQNIFVLDKNFNQLKSISFEKVDDVTFLHYNLENGEGDYYFQVIWENGISEYMSVHY